MTQFIALSVFNTVAEHHHLSASNYLWRAWRVIVDLIPSKEAEVNQLTKAQIFQELCAIQAEWAPSTKLEGKSYSKARLVRILILRRYMIAHFRMSNQMVAGVSRQALIALDLGGDCDPAMAERHRQASIHRAVANCFYQFPHDDDGDWLRR